MKFEYAAPIYSTIGVSKDSGTLADTLEPAGSYCIPAVTAEGDCLGAFVVGSYNGKWEIGSYMIGLDFIAAAEQYGTGDSCLIEIPQLGGDLGFLVKDNGEENYYSILSNASTAQDGNADVVLTELRVAISENDSLADGMGSENFSDTDGNSSVYLLGILIVLFAAVIGSIYVIRRQKK